MSGALVAQAINESIGTAGFQGLDAILKEYLGLIAEQAGTARVPISRTINGHSLASDVDLDNNDVGAAPAGFGLGDNAVSSEALDGITKTGFYYAPLDGAICLVIHENLNASHAVQTAVSVANVNVQCKKIRCKTGGVWSEWEWVNPPMQIGVEYRTTERCAGKVVYAKRIDFGESANDKVVSYTSETVTPIRYSGVVGTCSVPHIFSNDLGNIYTTHIVVNGNAVRMYCGSQQTGKKSYVDVWYVKN